MAIYIRNISHFDPKPRIVIQCLSNTAVSSRLVGNALMYALDMEEVAVVEGENSFPSVAIVRNGIVQHPIRIYVSDGLFLVFSEISIPNAVISDLINALFNWYKQNNVSRVYTISGITSSSSSVEIPTVMVALSHPELSEEIENKGLVFLERGAIYGSVGLSLLNGKKHNIPVISLIAETKDERDYETTMVLMESIKSLTGLEVNVSYPPHSSFFHYFPDESEMDEEESFDDDDEGDFDDDFSDDYFDPTDLL